MKMYIFHARANSAHGIAIRLLTRGEWNHSGVVFERSSGNLVYFESYWKRDKVTGKTGIRGPVPWQDIIDWSKKSKRNRFCLQELPYSPEAIERAYDWCISKVGVVRYAHVQLLHNIKLQLFGLGQSVWGTSPNKMTCSEFAARAWEIADDAEAEHRPLRLSLEVGTKMLFDYVAPSGRRYGLADAIARWKDYHGVATIPD